ncbi:hypothetical protein M3627_06710 [Psychrobacillus sp. MER TA 171]|nr:hypothetical protein [Psychrobacillus sp. MER TA 171]
MKVITPMLNTKIPTNINEYINPLRIGTYSSAKLLFRYTILTKLYPNGVLISMTLIPKIK